jgi:hypothetical protein
MLVRLILNVQCVYVRKYVRGVCVCVCVCVYSGDREHGFPNRLFSWCRVQRTHAHAVWEHAVSLLPTIPAIIRLVTTRSLDRPVAGERRDAGSKTAQDSFPLHSVER